MIKVENVKKVFNAHSRNRNEVLKGVSFELPDRGLIAIFGKSGSGKTTLLNIMGGLEEQSSGTVYINGESTTGARDKIRNRCTGFIFQNYYLERGCTVSEIMKNAMLVAGYRDEKLIAKRAKDALTLVDMERYKNKLSDALSGGQQQRVAIARALVKGSEIIFADEPTGNLDAENTIKVMDILKEISRDRLVVLVTHEVSLIKRYADSYIKLVDGRLTDDISIDDELSGLPGGDNYAEQAAVADDALCAAEHDEHREEREEISETIPQDGRKSTGKLFRFSNVLRGIRKNKEKGSTLASLVKKVFIFAMAVLTGLFSLGIFNVVAAEADVRSLNGSSLYVPMTKDIYRDIRRLDDSLYDSVDFFALHRQTGEFSYSNLASLSGITVSYAPASVSEQTEEELEYGEMPEESEVLISRALAERLKRDIGVGNLRSDRAMKYFVLDDEWNVSGIVHGEEPIVYFNRSDYVNYLGVYSTLSVTDRNGLFIGEEYSSNSFETEICLSDGSVELAENEVILEVNRNSLYLMSGDVAQADYLAASVNSYIARNGASDAFAVADSMLYIRRVNITRGMDVDIRIYVTQSALDDIFVYLAPNPDNVSTSSENRNEEFFFEITTESDTKLNELSNHLRDRGIVTADLNAIRERETTELKSEAASPLMIYGIVTLLLLFIYYFMEKSESIQNSKDYGVFRAIGVNKGNLLFREWLTSTVKNILPYFVSFIVSAVVIGVMLALSGTTVGMFIGFAAGLCVVGAGIMTLISIIPYLFVLWQTPAEILSRYDI